MSHPVLQLTCDYHVDKYSDNNTIVSPVVSTTLGCHCGDRECLTRKIRLKEPVIIKIRHFEAQKDKNIQCLFLDIEK